MTNLALLKSEIETGPIAATLAPLVASGNDAGIAKALNEPTATLINRESVTANELQAQVVASEYAALSADKRELWSALLTASAFHGFPLSLASFRIQIAAIWVAGTTTRTNLASLQTRPGSRAEIAVGQNIDAADVAAALRG